MFLNHLHGYTFFVELLKCESKGWFYWVKYSDCLENNLYLQRDHFDDDMSDKSGQFHILKLMLY